MCFPFTFCSMDLLHMEVIRMNYIFAGEEGKKETLIGSRFKVAQILID